LVWSLVHLLFIYLIRTRFQLHGKSLMPLGPASVSDRSIPN
jgi:hypothetical protein